MSGDLYVKEIDATAVCYHFDFKFCFSPYCTTTYKSQHNNNNFLLLFFLVPGLNINTVIHNATFAFKKQV